jgi:hypothetical protein
MFFDPEDGGKKFMRNSDRRVPDYTALLNRRQYSSLMKLTYSRRCFRHSYNSYCNSETAGFHGNGINQSSVPWTKGLRLRFVRHMVKLKEHLNTYIILHCFNAAGNAWTVVLWVCRT